MKKISMRVPKRFAVFLIALCAAPLVAYADVSVVVPDHCTVTDTDGVAHMYSGQHFAICAMQTALDAGSISSVQFSNAYPSLGLFVTTIDGVIADSNSQYWALYQNGGYASHGLSQLPVAAGDTVTLELHDFSDNYLGHRLTLDIASLAATPSSPAPPVGNTLVLHDPFDTPRALAYLASAQHADGSFGSPLLDDWVAIASAGGGAGDLRAKLEAYEEKNAPALASATDYERHAMALEALGIDPYAGTGADYIAPIVSRFDGVQIGDPSLINDDMFSLFPLLKAGYGADDDIISKTAEHVIRAQKSDGSWEESVDLTAAGVQALAGLRQLPGTADAVSKALGYLHTQQNADGGFGNSFSTSWALQAVAASDGTTEDWNQSSYHTPQYHLATLQANDGGLEEGSASDTRVWATAYAIPAVARKSWNDLLQAFPKPTPIAAATSTPGISATSTPATTTVAAASEPLVAPVFTHAPAAQRAVEVQTGQSREEQKPGSAPIATTSEATANQTAAAAAGANGFLNKMRESIIALLRIWL